MRANTFVPPSLPIYYFEVEVVSKGREGYLQLPPAFGWVSLWFRVSAFTLVRFVASRASRSGWVPERVRIAAMRSGIVWQSEQIRLGV